jgi:hypothetical protein
MLRTEDIRRFQRGASGPDYITLHRLKVENYDPGFLANRSNLEAQLSPLVMLGAAYTAGVNIEAVFQGRGERASLPSTVILDYVYGVAAYQAWHSEHGDVSTVMDNYRREHYAQIPPLPRDPPDDTDDTDDTFQPDNTDSEYTPGDTSESDIPTDSDYKLPEPGERYTSTRRRDDGDLSRAMDELNMVLMYVTRGITPNEAAERRQKEIEQEERAAQEAGRSKVMEWRDHMDVC